MGIKDRREDRTKVLMSFEGKHTNWVGLWYHWEKNYYSSPTINLSQLKNFKGNVRLYVLRNKFYEDDDSKPEFVFNISANDSERSIDLEIIDENEEIVYSEEEVIDMLKHLKSDAECDDICSVEYYLHKGWRE